MENDINLMCLPASICLSNENNIKENYSVTKTDFLWFIISIIVRPLAIIFNIYLAFEYYNKGLLNYSLWTIACVIFPMLITTTIQVFMYYDDKKHNKNARDYNWYNILLHIFLLPFLFRYCQPFFYAILSKRAEIKCNRLEQKKNYEYMLQTDTDIALIRIFECFLEIAPQKTLQIAIMLPFNEIMNLQILSIASSIISLSWCLVSYQRCIRFSRKEKNTISTRGTIIHLLWQISLTVSRILSLAIIANLFPMWTIIACFLHSIVMTLWVFCFDRSPFCSDKILLSFLFSFFLGIVYIFNYILPKEGRTLYRYIFFYIIIGIENVACILITIFFIHKLHFTIIFIISIIIGITYLLSLIFMCSYYKFCHPNIMLTD